ncbi:MAG: cyclic nucleotide-binding domain-containing protein [Gammaproteobacteria bacterium]
MVDSKHSLPDEIRKLVPVNGLATEFQDQIADQAAVIGYRKGRYVFHQGDRDGYAFYLLEGCVDLYADDRLAEKVTAGTERARYPLAQLQPRQLSAKAKTAVKILRLERAALDKLLTMEHAGREEASVTPAEQAPDHSSDWMTRMLQSEIFGRIPAANIQRIFACMEEVSVDAGDVIVHQGGSGDFYYIVREGRCVVTYAPSPSAKPVVLAELGVGDSFGEEALVAEATRNATVTMLTDGLLMRLTKEHFIDLIKKPSLESVSFSEAQELVQQGALWLDVRFLDESQHAALQGSINLPLNLLRTHMKTLEPGKKYVVYCDTGGRSAAGAFLLAQHGFEVAHLTGGLMQSPLSEVLLKADSQQALTPPRSTISEQVEGCAVEQTGDNVVRMSDAARATDLDKRAPTIGEWVNDAAAPPAALNVDVQVAALKAELARLNLQLEEAVQLKTRADVDRRVAEEQAALRVRKERDRLAQEKARASEAFSEVQRLRKELELERKQTEEAAAHRRQELEALRRQLEEQTAQRIREQEARLEAEANQQLEEIVRLTTEADKARYEAAEEVKRSLEREWQRLEVELAHKREAEENRILHLRADIERRLGEEQAKREQELEQRLSEAMKLKAEAEAAKQAAEVAIEEKLRQERQHIEQKAAQANEVLAEAQRLKQELEAARYAAEEQAAHQRDQEEERMRHLGEEADNRLKAEQQRLQAECARHAEELARFQEAKEQAQARWEEERMQLEAAVVEAKQRVAEVEERAEKTEKSRRSLEESLEQMRVAHQATEQRIRQELGEALAVERQRVEAEVARNTEIMEQLRQEKVAAEAARHAAAQEAERIIEKQRIAFERMREEAETDEDPLPEQRQEKLDQSHGQQESLRDRLECEMREWLSRQGALSAAGSQDDPEAKWQHIKAKSDAAKKAVANANAKLLYEVATQLSRKDK